MPNSDYKSLVDGGVKSPTGTKAFGLFPLMGYEPIANMSTAILEEKTDAVAILEAFPELTSVAVTDLSPTVVFSARMNVISAVHESPKTVQAPALNAAA
ncbi:uncharacterized protein BP01DRAFT_386785 [Aspergillus saccharolyticus JOP 1030-1]|uniref:Uncharacterized protein n=1 Tax=Aspergillus saccharolyticus JOP 1030-1 TaxID=1450539 RepID=A0A318Z441_9EURO|nr:hypothetical protein BP01DRAFT_386785 [Aspergillus saccharolyticus JOP 1030-1]PYH41097.1 hypothetical protein BP01DRAFT_386785 [Aspergillus saccharolyticus JOP 1030-1]